MPAPAVHNLIDRVRELVRQDVRKVAILGTLLLFLGLLIVRQTAGSGSPAPAAASANLSQDNAVSAFGPGAPNRPAAGEVESPVARWLAAPAHPMQRNLFHVKLDLFPASVTKTQPSGNSGGLWDEVAKSLLDHADQQERRRELLSTLSGQAKALKVTSVMMGPKPRAVINGELVGEGDVVAGFRVVKIEARRIVIDRDGIALEVTMN